MRSMKKPRSPGRRAAAALSMVLALVGCGGMAGSMDSASGLRVELGSYSAGDIAAEFGDLMRREGFDMEIQNGPPSILYQTAWKAFLPTEEEAEAGVVDARTRIRLRGRSRASTDSNPLYTATFEVEHQVRVGSMQAEWTERPAATDFRNTYRELARQLRVELESLRGIGGGV